MKMLDFGAYLLIFLIFAVCIGALPVIRKEKKCSWLEAFKILLRWMGILKEEPNEIMFDSILAWRILDVVNQFTNVKKLKAIEVVKSDKTCYSSGLPYLLVRFIPKSNSSLEEIAFWLQDVFNTHVATHYPRHIPESIVDIIKVGDGVVCFQIRYAWTDEEEKLLKAVHDRSLNCRETKAKSEHKRPSDYRLNNRIRKKGSLKKK